MNAPTFDENGHLATVVVDAKKLSELTDELVDLREQVKARASVETSLDDVLRELARMYEAWAAGDPVGVGRLMQAYDDWLD